MKVFTNDPSFSNNILGYDSEWTSDNPSSDKDPGLQQINKQIFLEMSEIYERIVPDEFWNYGWFVKHSPYSQFEMLTKLISTGVPLPDKLICLAGSGDNFKGFRNRSWEAIPGNLHVTFHFAPNKPIPHFFSGFLMIAAVSVVQILDSLAELKGRVTIKWVNDIMIEDAKVSGVLTHTSSKGQNVTSAVLGVGINILTVPKVKPNIFVPKVTALNEHLKDVISMKSFYTKLLKTVQNNYRLLVTGQYERLLSLYLSYSNVLGKNVQVYSDPVSGKPQVIATGIVEEIGQHLELKISGQEEVVRSGRVVLDSN